MRSIQTREEFYLRVEMLEDELKHAEGRAADTTIYAHNREWFREKADRLRWEISDLKHEYIEFLQAEVISKLLYPAT